MSGNVPGHASGDTRPAQLRAPRGVTYALLAALLVGLAALAWHTYSRIERELTDAALARRALVARLAAATLSERLDRMVDLSVSLATRVRFASLVAAGNWDSAAEIMQGVPSTFPHVERVFLADTGGTLRADAPALPGVRGRNFSQRDWYRGVSEHWQPYVSKVYKRAAEPSLNVIAVATPVREPAGGRVTGVLVVQISLDAFFDWARAIDPGMGELAVIDGRGGAAFRTGAPAQAPIADLSEIPAVRSVMQGQSGVEVAADRVYAFYPAGHSWSVLLQEPAASAFAVRDGQLAFMLGAYALFALFCVVLGGLAARIGRERRRAAEHAVLARELERQVTELSRTQDALERQTERLRILRAIDNAVVTGRPLESIAAAAVAPLRELLGVGRAIVNRFDLAAGEVEWIAAAGRKRVHAGPGVRYPVALMGDLEAMRRGVVQKIDTRALPPSRDRDALLDSGVDVYLAVPMIADGELLGAISFGGDAARFDAEQVEIVREVADQLAVALKQALLNERIRRHAAELERRVEERTAELQTTNRELEAFSYSVSHDLRAPLRAIDGFARMLEEDFGATLDAEGTRLLGVVRANARQMGQLIDDLLAFSRVSRAEPVKWRVDMAGLVDEVLGELGARDRIRPATLPDAQGDRALLRQVWLNLVSNALKYSGKRERPEVQIGGKAEAGELVYWVKDNGVGFDMRYADKLFGVFQRLHAADEFPGTGVGLAIVQRVVTRHGGRVWAESRPGEGAAFRFSLPAGD